MNILIIGATATLAEHTARLYAAEHARLFLVGRNSERLSAISDDLRVRGASFVRTAVMDVNQHYRHGEVLNEAWQALGTVDAVLLAYGTLPNPTIGSESPDYAVCEFNTNATATISMLVHVVNRLKQQGQGHLAVITSVAGDRGRASNYLYGSAKAAVSTYLSGLRQWLWRYGVQVTDIRPGLVDTPMTAQFKKGILWVTPGVAACRIRHAMESNQAIVYVPGFWRWIMLVIRTLPDSIFRRIRL